MFQNSLRPQFFQNKIGFRQIYTHMADLYKYRSIIFVLS